MSWLFVAAALGVLLATLSAWAWKMAGISALIPLSLLAFWCIIMVLTAAGAV